MPTPPLRRTGKPASRAQQNFLRVLAEQTGSTFSLPRDAADASRQITQLKKRTRSDQGDQVRERREVQADLARFGDAARHHAADVTGYGSSARWTHHTSPEAHGDA